MNSEMSPERMKEIRERAVPYAEPSCTQCGGSGTKVVSRSEHHHLCGEYCHNACPIEVQEQAECDCVRPYVPLELVEAEVERLRAAPLPSELLKRVFEEMQLEKPEHETDGETFHAKDCLRCELDKILWPTEYH